MRVSDFVKVSLTLLCCASATTGGGIIAAAELTLNPGDNVQTQVNLNPAGTVFLFNPGSYDLQSIVPKAGNVFDGQGWATLDGKNTTKTAFRGTASNVTIQNLTIQNYNSDLQKAVVDAEFGNAWTIRNNTIASNFSVGVNFGNNSQVIGNQLINNGQAGFAGGGGGWLVENNLISNNNTRNLDWGFEAGGGKVTEATSGTFRDNTSFGNGGPGIWLDIDANNILIENNLCAKNLGPGIMVEISQNAIVRYNTLINNGEVFRWDNASLLISSSENNKVYGNVVDVPSNRLGIFVMSQGREHTAINNEIYENEVWIRGTRAGSHGVDRDDDAPVFTTNDFHDNSYYVTSLPTRHFSWEDDYTLAQTQVRGRELNSTIALLTNVLGDYNRNGIVDTADYSCMARRVRFDRNQSL